MKKQILSFLLAVTMVLSLFSPISVFASSINDAAETEAEYITVDEEAEQAADAHIIVAESAVTAAETTVGALYELDLSTIFTDSEEHVLTYTLDKDYGTQTKIADGKFVFSVSEAGTYNVTITASCEDGDSASYTIVMTVNAAADGDEEAYNYNETPAASVTVNVTVSNDGLPIMGDDGTAISHLSVTVPYFDLANYGLEQYYRYHTENGQGPYVDTNVVERPTVLHLYIYLVEHYYLGIPWNQCGVSNTLSKVLNYSEADDVLYFNGELAYTAKNMAFTPTQSATSLYMVDFWGHDQNLMYYRNHRYPLMSAGWGATADYMLLQDGDKIDVGMFTNWSFNQTGSFLSFNAETFTGNAGEVLTVTTMKTPTSAGKEGSTVELMTEDLNVELYTKDWALVESATVEAKGEGQYEITLPEEAGTYYVMATDRNAATGSADKAPATAVVVVKDVVKVSSVTLDQTALELKTDETVTLTATVDPEDAADETVTWTSSDEAVATVVDGVVTAVGKGEATITAQVGDVTAQCTVTVTEAQTDSDDSGSKDISEYYKDYPFDYITYGENKTFLVDITAGTQSTSYYGDLPTYKVVIPEGVETVDVTFPSGQSFVEWTAVYNTDGSGTDYGNDMVGLTTNDDGTVTVSIPMGNYTDKGLGIFLENSNYAWVYGFDFTVGTITDVNGGSDNKDISEYYKDYLFDSITYGIDNDFLVDITASTITSMSNGDIPVYQVIIPEGTEYVNVSFPVGNTFVKYTGEYTVSTGEATWGTEEVTVTENGDGTVTVVIPTDAVTDKDKGLVLENSSYEWVCGFNFVTGDITVVEKPSSVITEVTINQTEAELEVDQTVTLIATIVPSYVLDKTVTWTSSNEAIATVEKGVVTAAGVGEATITATAGGISATCTVTVIKKNNAPSVSDGLVKYHRIDTNENFDPEFDKVFNDIDGDTLAYTVEIQNADSNNMDTSGYIFTGSAEGAKNCASDYQFTSAETGVYLLKFTATDGKLNASYIYEVTVTEPGDGTVVLEDGKIVIDVCGAVLVDHTYKYQENIQTQYAGTFDGYVHQFVFAEDTPKGSAVHFMLDCDEDAYMAQYTTSGAMHSPFNFRTWGSDEKPFFTYVKDEDGTKVCTGHLFQYRFETLATGISIENTELEVEKGLTVAINAVLEPSGATDRIVWVSADESIATVENGVVTGVAEGKTTITATVGLFSASCDVTVIPNVLEGIKKAAKTELDSYKDPEEYREAQQTELTEIIEAAKTSIEEAESEEEVAQELARAKSKMDAVKTDAQLTEEEESQKPQESPVEQFVTRLYEVCLNRIPDESGKADWVKRLETKAMTGVQVASGFVFSDEFKNKNLCNEDYVEQLYEAFMGRTSDLTGKQYWLELLKEGTTREEVFNGFALSEEFAALCKTYGIEQGEGIDIPQRGTVPQGPCTVCGKDDGVTAFVKRLYNVCLDRESDAAGLEDWTTQLWNHTASGKSVAAGFIFSEEFKNKNYDNSEYLDYLYRAMMGREADPVGKADWMDRMGHGWTRERVFEGFVGSDEFSNICNEYGIIRD